MQSRLAGAYAKRSDPPFQGRDAAFQHVVRRVAYPPVAVPLNLEIEQGGSVFDAVERVRDGLIDGYGDRPGYGINLVAAVDCNRFATQISSCERPLKEIRTSATYRLVINT